MTESNLVVVCSLTEKKMALSLLLGPSGWCRLIGKKQSLTGPLAQGYYQLDHPSDTFKCDNQNLAYNTLYLHISLDVVSEGNPFSKLLQLSPTHIYGKLWYFISISIQQL
jgi:hypothetical protein